MNQPPPGQNPSAAPADLQPAQPPQTVRVPMPTGASTVTYGILIFTVIIYGFQLLSVAIFGYAVSQVDWLEVYGARINDAILAGELWRFITPAFLHGSVPHIFFNMYALLSIGSFLERQFGHRRFALLYLLGAFAGNVTSFLFASGFSVGASTAVFGLIAAEWVLFYHNRKLFGSFARRAMGNAVFIIAVNLFIGLAPGIDNWGHVGGLVGGAMFAWFASPRWQVTGFASDLKLEDRRDFRDVVVGGAAVIVLFGAMAAWGFIK